MKAYQKSCKSKSQRRAVETTVIIVSMAVGGRFECEDPIAMHIESNMKPTSTVRSTVQSHDWGIVGRFLTRKENPSFMERRRY